VLLKSDAFENGQRVPDEFTCAGVGVSPPLYWVEAPERTGAFALIVDDPDAPDGTFTHWLIYNMPGDHQQLQQAVPQVATMTTPTLQGENSQGTIGFAPFCPPPGAPAHRYRFRLYALDAPLDLKGGDSREAVDTAMQQVQVLDQAELVGTYSRPG
jgi:Raf kinase inhibitor-like YbhB/YbcL family protein